MTTYVLGSNDSKSSASTCRQAGSRNPRDCCCAWPASVPACACSTSVPDSGTSPSRWPSLVGPAGQVVGIDNDDRLLAAASARAEGRTRVRFAKGDVRTWLSDEPFDAVVGRLILFHLPDPVRRRAGIT